MRRRPLLALTVALLAVTAGCATGPRPDQRCQACSEFGSAAHEVAGWDPGVLNTTATLRLDEGGTATWVVRHRLWNADEAPDGETLDRIAEAAVGDAVVTDGDYYEVSAVDGRLDGETVVVTYTVHDAVSRGVGGTLVLEVLAPGGGRVGAALRATRLTVVAPPGYRVTNAPGGDADGQTAVWRAEERIRFGSGPVVAAPTGGVEGTLVTWATLAAAATPGVLWEGLGMLWPGALALLLSTLALTALARIDRGDRERRGAAVAVVGSVALALGFVAAPAGIGAWGAVVTVAAVSIAMGFALSRTGHVTGPRRFAALGLAVAAVVSVALALAFPGGVVWYDYRGRGRVLAQVLLAVPPVLFGVVAAGARSRRAVAAALGGMCAAMALLAAPGVYGVTDGPGAIAYVAAAGVWTVLGLPLWALGATLTPSSLRSA